MRLARLPDERVARGVDPNHANSFRLQGDFPRVVKEQKAYYRVRLLQSREHHGRELSVHESEVRERLHARGYIG